MALNLRQDLEAKPFDNNSKCDGCECDSTYVILKTVVTGFLTNPVTKRSQISRAKNIPFGLNKQTTCGEKEGGKLTTTTNNYKQSSPNSSK